MSARVTVVTPTIATRHAKLEAAMASVQAQTFRDWVHLVIPDGPDPTLFTNDLRTRVVPLGRPHRAMGNWNRMLGGLLADTPLIAYLDDDNLWRPRHLEVLVGALENNPSAGFAYAQMEYADGRVLGDETPAMYHIDTSMIVHRVELLDIANWGIPVSDPYIMDGLLVERWIAAGITSIFVPEVTVDYPQKGCGAP
jgi:glycosyltransferase involved in cell wall biosynthesis